MSPSADVSCRIAWGDDAHAMASVQLASLRSDTPHLLPAELRGEGAGDAAAVQELAEIWRGSLTRPADARQRVLVALERSTVRGFALTSPSTDPDADPGDGELLDLVVDPAHRREGHGSRLLQAAMDTLAADRFRRATTWVVTEDDRRRAFLTAAGWEPDGAHRTLAQGDEADPVSDSGGDQDGDLGGAATTRQVRLHVAVEAP